MYLHQQNKTKQCMVFYQGNVSQIASLSLGEPYQLFRISFIYLTNNFNSSLSSQKRFKVFPLPSRPMSL